MHGYGKVKALKAQKGFGLLEMIAVTILLAIGAVAYQQKIEAEREDALMKNAASHAALIASAVSYYITDFGNTTLAANPTTNLTEAMLRASPVHPLPQGVAWANPWGSDYSIRVRRIGASAPYTYDAMVIADTPYVDSRGNVRPDIVMGTAGKIGSLGGMTTGAAIESSNYVPTAGTGWTLTGAQFGNPALSATASRLAMYVDGQNGAYDAVYLRLDGEWPMIGDLKMADNAIRFGTEKVIKSACAVNNAIAMGEGGDLVVCKGNLWEKVANNGCPGLPANYGSLPAGLPSGTLCPTADTGRVYMWNGGTWVATAVDQNGDLVVPRDLVVSRNTALQGNVELGNDTADIVRLGVIATEGAACGGGNGAMGRTAAGVILTCQSGVWQKASPSTGWRLDQSASCPRNMSTQKWGVSCAGGGYASPGTTCYHDDSGARVTCIGGSWVSTS